jgi:hypothetical protein
VPNPVAAIVASSAGSSIIGGMSAKKAAKAQTQAAQQASDVQRQMFERQIQLQAPFREAGLTAQNRFMELMGLGQPTGGQDFGRYARDFSMEDYQQDPGYAFRLSEGMKALERSAAARGGLLSGSMLKGAQRFGQDQASEEYQNAFNRYQTNRANQLNPLAGLMSAGQSGANTLTSAAGELGGRLGENYMQAGNARASGYIGQGNALSSALGTVGNYYANKSLNDALTSYYSSAAMPGQYSMTPAPTNIFRGTIRNTPVFSS